MAGVSREAHSASAASLGKSSGAANSGPRRVVQFNSSAVGSRAARGEPVEHERHAERIRSDQRLRRRQRLRSPRDFGRARGRGRRVGGQLVTLTYVRQPDAPGPARVGVVAGKRVGGAVVRNRVKRRLREALRRELARIPAGWDLVCDAKSPAAEAPYAALASELRALLARAGLVAGSASEGQPSPATSVPSENRSKQP